jgi:ribosomal protein L11 methylase PrmA
MQKEPGSFRDRSGFIFYDNNEVYRAVHESYKQQYDFLFSSGLYKLLIEQNLLISHEELSFNKWSAILPNTENEKQVYKILQPEKIPYISYPYEWCFQQLKDAALLTLNIQLKALEHDMTLKDASAFNVQFINGKPVFIDTLSFDYYKEGEPWIAYRQFCCHFLAPLAIMSYVATDLRRLSELFADGIPLHIASSLLPFKTRFAPFYLLHIHYHARLEKKYSGDIEASSKVKHQLSKAKLITIIHHLISGIQSIKLPSKKTEWINYYDEFSYSNAAIESKKQLVKEWASVLSPKITWDLGCNTGLFTEVVQEFARQIISFDSDHLAIERLYATIKEKGFKNVLPLVLDLNNPSAAIGWANHERKSFTERGKADLILALALIHHLCIGNNVPFFDVAEFMSKHTEWLIIEFVPKQDKQVKRLLVTREDIFADYTRENFETVFEIFFTIENKQLISEAERTLYMMKRK